LPFAGTVDQILEGLKRDKLIEVRSSQMGLGESAYLYAITGAGIIRAREALDRCQYAGPAPYRWKSITIRSAAKKENASR
jgi:hypothetical protein